MGLGFVCLVLDGRVAGLDASVLFEGLADPVDGGMDRFDLERQPVVSGHRASAHPRGLPVRKALGLVPGRRFSGLAHNGTCGNLRKARYRTQNRRPDAPDLVPFPNPDPAIRRTTRRIGYA